MTIRLQDEAFDQGLRAVRDAVERIRTARDRADRQVSGYVREGWRGLAADAFTAAWQEWCSAARDTERGLAAMADLMDAAQRDLHTCDDAVRAGVSSWRRG